MATLREHLRACAHCRSALRAYRAAPGAAAALVPSLPLAQPLLGRINDFLANGLSRLRGTSGAHTASGLTSGGGGGAGAMALGKAAAVCAATAGGAAACVAAGVIAPPAALERPVEVAPAVVRTAPAVVKTGELNQETPVQEDGGRDQGSRGAGRRAKRARRKPYETAPAPEPAAEAVEYAPPPPEPAPTPEPAPAPEPVPPPEPVSAPEAAPAPVEPSGGNPAGEFGP